MAGSTLTTIGQAHLMRPGMYNAYHEVSVPAREGEGSTSKANVVGNLCENNDWYDVKYYSVLAVPCRVVLYAWQEARCSA